MSNEQKQVLVHIQDEMDVSQRSWLEAKLDHENGINAAWFDTDDPHRLVVQYEPDHFSHVTMLDTVKQYGFHGEIIDN